MTEPTVDTIETLTIRYEKGIAWLTERDPDGSLYFVAESGIKPHHPKPAWTEQRRADFDAYYNALELWRKLDRKLYRMEIAAQKEIPA